MERPKPVFALLAAGLFVLLLSPNQAGAKPLPSPQILLSVSGESRTLLPDGRVLITGGQDKSGSVSRIAAIDDPNTGALTPLPTTLNIARAWHTATVLPSGSVLIFGGIGTAGTVVAQAELFDPGSRTFQLIAVGPTPRAFHTATLLTDGRLLIAGGVSAAG